MARFVAKETIKLMIQCGIDVSKSRVGVLGVTFKENCPDVRNSKVVDIVRELRSYGIDVVITDPHADVIDLQHDYGIELQTISEKSPVDALIIAVAHTEFRQLSAMQLRSLTKGSRPVISDVKSIYQPAELERAGFTVWRL
jgi:UDP-N-acetyl-D-glucosamine/UDP-N-acetyl-D-galactosamine dehydrogenase